MIIHYEIGKKEKFEIEKGTHRNSSLFVLLSGKYEYDTKEAANVICPYTLVFFKKGVAFHKRVLEPITYITVQLSDLPCNIETVSVPQDIQRLKSTIFYLVEAIRSNKNLAVITHFVNDILFLASKEDISFNDGLYDIIHEIEHNYIEKLTLEYLSHKFGYSKQTLISKFKNRYGITPMEFIINVRINEAKKLLIYTDMRICEIAEKCGFSDVYYFSNTFKKHTTLSPLKFRFQSKI